MKYFIFTDSKLKKGFFFHNSKRTIIQLDQIDEDKPICFIIPNEILKHTYHKSLIKNKQPRAVPTSGNKDEVIDYVLRSTVDSRDMPYQDVSYTGIVLYSSFISESKFNSKYGQEFANYITRTYGRPIKTGETIIECVVWIEEICGALPRPPIKDSSEFYKALKSMTPANSQEGFDQIINNSSNSSNKGLVLKHINKIRRFPRAYYVESAKNQLGPLSINDNVRVRFPY